MHHGRMLMRWVAVTLALLVALPALADEDFLHPEQAFRVEAEPAGPEAVALRWQIARGYYLYRDKFAFGSDTPGIEVRPVAWPAALTKHDEYFGEVTIYRDSLVFEVPLARAAEAGDALALTVTYQGCADAGLCYPPERRTLEVALPPGGGTADSGGLGAVEPRSALAGLLSTLDRTGSRALGLAADELLPVEEAYRLSADVLAPDRLRVTWAIADGTYLYRDTLALALEDHPDVALGRYALPPARIAHDTVRPDGEVGDVAIYDEAIAFEVPLVRSRAAPTEVTLVARYQGCAERGVCYPPQTRRLRLALPALPVAEAAGAAGAARVVVAEVPPPDPVATSVAEPVSEPDRLAAVLAGGNLWAILALFFGLGLLLAATPCVFPMIPILSGIIAGQGQRLTTGRAFVLSLVYVLAMAVTYTVAGVLAGLFGANLQAAFQNVWILAAFALLFVALALSMFGLYDLQLPSGLQTRLAELSRRQRGGTLTGVAIMGLLSALIVGPCVAPPLAGALIFIGQTGDAALGGLALFALSLGMGAPLIAIGTTAGKLLPRAGAWMEAVKAVFGVLLLAVAIWLLERVLPVAVTMALWGLLLVCSAVYMGALQPVAAGASGWTRLFKGLGLALLVYGTLMLVGAAAGSKDTLQPLRGLTFGDGVEAAEAAFRPIKTVADLERELAAARAAGRPVMLDFYADWCVTCKELDRHTFADPAVVEALRPFVLLRADVTANDADDRALLQGLIGLPGPPAIIFWDGTGRELRGYRIVGFKSAPEFVAHLRQVTP
ncbi:protein-disulfide reductase DsbD [Thiococcus pfennigii]|uniref:protein-disulfide reductase DsbD n=1 Tax=Thiococcus pfennigii TaxID=1057 RepID=UPI0019072AAE|nr:protein-disulfide reductase DsbD [Thiococcus pfennigii]MBK1732967.1 thiol:disulfide interchange protein [Thiococcus pfennigii]